MGHPVTRSSLTGPCSSSKPSRVLILEICSLTSPQLPPPGVLVPLLLQEVPPLLRKPPRKKLKKRSRTLIWEDSSETTMKTTEQMKGSKSHKSYKRNLNNIISCLKLRIALSLKVLACLKKRYD